MTVSRRQFQTVLLDLDDCLYRIPEMPDLVKENIQRYMEEKLLIPKEQIPTLCYEMYSSFGTTMAGLVAKGYQIDFDDWHKDVHWSLPYQKLLQRDDKLRSILQRIPLPKYVFTNADRKHAEICLEIMGIRDLFKEVICFESIMEAAVAKGYVHHNLPVVCKPVMQAMQLALEQAGHADPRTTIYFDDSTRNVTSGHQLGMFSVLVGRTGADSAADMEMMSLYELPQALPHLFPPGVAEKLAEEEAGPGLEPGQQRQQALDRSNSLLSRHSGEVLKLPDPARELVSAQAN